MRTFMAFITLDEDTALRYQETNGIHPDMTPGEYLEMEFGWLKESGINLECWRIMDDDDTLLMARYTNYLARWAYEHGDDDTESTPMSLKTFKLMEAGIND